MREKNVRTSFKNAGDKILVTMKSKKINHKVKIVCINNHYRVMELVPDESVPVGSIQKLKKFLKLDAADELVAYCVLLRNRTRLRSCPFSEKEIKELPPFVTDEKLKEFGLYNLYPKVAAALSNPIIQSKVFGKLPLELARKTEIALNRIDPEKFNLNYMGKNQRLAAILRTEFPTYEDGFIILLAGFYLLIIRHFTDISTEKELDLVEGWGIGRPAKAYFAFSQFKIFLDLHLGKDKVLRKISELLVEWGGI